MELWLYCVGIFLIILVLIFCIVAERWIGLCFNCQAQKYLPDLTGNKPTRLEAVSVKKPYRVIQPNTRIIQETQVANKKPRSDIVSVSPVPQSIGEKEVSSIRSSVSEIYQEIEQEQFLCKVDVHNQTAIYTVENDNSVQNSPAPMKRNHQSNYCSFLKI